MIPTFDSKVKGVQAVTQPSLTYKWDTDTKRIGGTVDGLDAIVQAANKTLMTIRYSSPTYTGDYGHEINNLIGTDIEFAKVEIKRAIKEALIVDDRITTVTSFVIEQTGSDSFEVQFQLITIEGTVTLQTGVSI